MDKKLDVLFIHPVVHRKGQLLHVIMPVGLFSLASTLKKNGYKTSIIHVGVEEILNQEFSLSDKLKEYRPDIVCIDLHWYVHIYEAIEIARLAKECCGSFTVLGGYTASFYDQEIIKTFPYVDAVIRGDGEVPLLKVVKEYYSGKDYTGIANTTFRQSDQVIRNEISYVNFRMEDTATLDLGLLEHWEAYLRIDLWGKSDVPIYALFDPKVMSSIDLMVYRGCPYKCSYCGGGREAQSEIFGRNGFVFKDLDQLMGDCFALKKQGVEEIRVEYVPISKSDEFYLDWFRAMQSADIKFAGRFSFWSPPSPELMRMLNDTFSKITFVMSPDSGSDRIRKKFKSCFYTNESLYETLKLAKKQKVIANTQLYFMVGFPEETKEEYNQTLELAKDLLNKELINQATFFALNIEPASPFHLDPDRFGIKLFRKSFEDFYNWGKEVASDKNLQHYLGYEREDMSEKEILDLAKNFNREMSRMKTGSI